ncbi:pro-sigmaK processing inhibitor BofA family protein [Bacillus alveayuensis]|uniref:pro-sigmaK processing inhibitor BofA family protein n=1 Tax=Aeribacillus alveayuensis TaxID=279215 RepID=UPI0005D12850|nr:pro-sigmaK processing inhibitor BofA family protein [Bacillus alveayuensis]
MEPIILIIGISGFILMLLLVGAPLKPVKLIGQLATKLVIGALLLFFLNAFGTSIGLHIPINVVTSSISGLLGLPGIAALIIIKTVIL